MKRNSFMGNRPWHRTRERGEARAKPDADSPRASEGEARRRLPASERGRSPSESRASGAAQDQEVVLVQVERFERDGEIIEVRDGREFHVTLVEIGPGRPFPGQGSVTKHRLALPGESTILGRRGGRITPEQEEYRAKRERRSRSSAYRLKNITRDVRCRWCGCELPAGGDVLVRWRNDHQRYSHVCVDCGDKRGYKIVRGGRWRRPKPQATAEDLQRLRDHWQAR